MLGYDPKTVESLARLLYNATRGDGTASWATMVRHGERDATSRQLADHWRSLAIASLDLVHGARMRMS